MNASLDLLYKGDREFRTVGASFLVSYLYFRFVDPDHRNWRGFSTTNLRVGLIKNNKDKLEGWVNKVKKCNPNLLKGNELDLSVDNLYAMLDQVEEHWFEGE